MSHVFAALRRSIVLIGVTLFPVGQALAQTSERPPQPAAGTMLDDATLSNARGGQAIVVGNQTLKSSISGSTIAGNYTAGAISLSDNAFSNFSGMGNVIINTGAQANLQSAMNVTVNLAN
jgi:hypothetical protein